MVRIAMVGDPGAGGTTVLGLLYATQVRQTAAEGSSFRFHVAPSSMPQVGAAFEQLQTGEFPARTAGASSGPIEFLFEPHPSLASSLRGRWLHGRSRPNEARRIAWTRAAFSDLRAHVASGGFPTEGARQLEGADVLAVLVPPPEGAGPGGLTGPERDDALAQTVSAARTPRPTGATPSTAVAFIFTMLDRLSDARRKELGLPGSLAERVPAEGRESIGLRLVRESLPKTAGLVGSGGPTDRVGRIPPQFFFSWVETEPSAPNRPRLRASPGGGWEPVYPFEEYVALISACDAWAGGLE